MRAARRASKSRSKLAGHAVTLYGEVAIRHGDRRQVVRNKLVGQALRDWINHIGSGNATSRWVDTNSAPGFTIRLGTGLGATGDGTTALVAEVTTAPNSISRAVDNPASGQYRAKFIAVWNAGTLAPLTITEMALKPFSMNLTLDASGATVNPLGARLSTTDGEFTAFTINPALPLTVEWRIVLTFA